MIYIRGKEANMLDCDITVSELKLHFRYYVHSRINTLGKGMEHQVRFDFKPYHCVYVRARTNRGAYAAICKKKKKKCLVVSALTFRVALSSEILT